MRGRVLYSIRVALLVTLGWMSASCESTGVQWVKEFENLELHGVEQVYGGGIVVYGAETSDTAGRRQYIARMDAFGNVVWEHIGEYGFVEHVFVDQDDVIYAAEKTIDADSFQLKSRMIVSYDIGGTVKWESSSPGGRYETMHIDSGGNVVYRKSFTTLSEIRHSSTREPFDQSRLLYPDLRGPADLKALSDGQWAVIASPDWELSRVGYFSIEDPLTVSWMTIPGTPNTYRSTKMATGHGKVAVLGTTAECVCRWPGEPQISDETVHREYLHVFDERGRPLGSIRSWVRGGVDYVPDVSTSGWSFGLCDMRGMDHREITVEWDGSVVDIEFDRFNSNLTWRPTVPPSETSTAIVRWFKPREGKVYRELFDIEPYDRFRYWDRLPIYATVDGDGALVLAGQSPEGGAWIRRIE